MNMREATNALKRIARTEKTSLRAGLLIGLAMLGSVSTAHAANVQDQADCHQVAQKDFDAAKALPSFGRALSGFESHYNTKMHACLVLLHYNYTDEPITTAHTLIDETGNHTYADYIKHVTKKEIIFCSFEPTPFAERKFCNSLDEFMAGIKPYMTE